jgi:hypothetical protein
VHGAILCTSRAKTLDSLSSRVSAITDYFFGALQHAASASQRAVRARLLKWNPSGIIHYSLCKCRLTKAASARLQNQEMAIAICRPAPAHEATGRQTIPVGEKEQAS